METTTLSAEVRTECGKGPSRRLRMEGKIPVVLYGPGIDPTPLTLAPKTLVRALRGERGRNSIFSIEHSGSETLAMVRDLVVEPVSRELLHVDFLKLDLEKEVNSVVTFKTKGRAVGVQKGGVLNVTRRDLPIRSKPADIPAFIEFDVSDVDMFQSISVADIPVPDGVVVRLEPKLTVVTVIEDRKVKVAATEEDAAAAPAEEAK